MASLRVKLGCERTKTENRITEVEKLLQIGGSITHVNKSWEGLSKQIYIGEKKTDEIISKLQNVKCTLTKLSLSKRAEMRESFSSLCSEAYNVVNKILDHVKILCDKKGSHLRVYFDELSTILELSSQQIEIRDKKKTELALKEMASLRVMLEHEKTETENRITEVENLLQIGGSITHSNKSWEGLKKQIDKGGAKTDKIISELQNVKYTPTELSVSKRAEVQEYFSSLCSEAYNVVNKIMDHVKILCDMKGSRFHVYFDELSTISEPSS